MVCTLGNSGDNKGCIPYCNGTCLVGAHCQQAFRGLELTPDGSVMAPEVYLVALANGPAATLRNCRGHVINRAYEAPAAARLRAEARSIVV